MSFNYKWTDNNIIVEFHGDLILEDINSANNIIYSDARFDTMQYQIADFSDVTSFNLTSENVKMVSVIDRTSTVWNNNIKIACISNNKIITDNIKIYLKIMDATAWSCKIFKSKKEALKWCKA